MDNILNEINNLDDEYKHNEIFMGKKKEVSWIKKKFRLIWDFKSEAIKEHHLKEILKIIGIEKDPSDIIL